VTVREKSGQLHDGTAKVRSVHEPAVILATHWFRHGLMQKQIPIRLDTRTRKGDAAMKTTRAVRFGNIAVAAVIGLLLTVPVQAEIKSHSGTLIVEQPGDLPEMAQVPGQALFLYQGGNCEICETYLYVEQQNGARLAIFDVTDPAKIKAAASVPINAPGAFDFVRYLNNRAELVRFRESGQLAELDLRNPKRPALKIASALSAPGHTESLGETGLVMINAHYRYVGGGVAHDYRVVDVSNPAHPIPLATIKQVKHKIVNEETGTTYLLGSDGLTVLRRPRVEEDYETEKIYEEYN
jgi:LVIVD repeat